MVVELNVISLAIFELQIFYLHQNRLEFGEYFNEIVKFYIIHIKCVHVRILCVLGLGSLKFTIIEIIAKILLDKFWPEWLDFLQP